MTCDSLIYRWKLGISADDFQEPRYVVNVHLLAPNAPTGMLKLLSWRSRTKPQTAAVKHPPACCAKC